MKLWTNALRQFRRYWVSSAFMVLGATIGISAIVFTLGTTLDLSLRTIEANPPNQDRTIDLAVAGSTPLPPKQIHESISRVPSLAALYITEPFNMAPMDRQPGLVTSAYVAGAVWHPPLLEGRFLETEDFRAESEPSIVIGRSLALDWFGRDRNVFGQTIELFGAEGPLRYRIVGVIGVDRRFTAWDYRIFLPITFDGGRKVRTFQLVTESPSQLASAESAAIGALGNLSPSVAVKRVPPQPVSPEVESTISLGKTATVLAAFVLVVASINCGNLAAFWAQRRRREIGIRQALGATSLQVVSLVVSEVVVLNSIGAILGLIVYGMVYQWTDLNRYLAFEWIHVIVAIVAGLLSGLMAGAVPALHVARMDPTDAMRSE